MKKKIFFICSGNTCRSPMAAALFINGAEKEITDNFDILSRGLSATDGEPASENAIAVMKEYGIDISGHRSARLTADELETGDLFVCMTYSHAMALINCGTDKEKITVLGISDPFGGSADVYRASAAEIKEKLCGVYNYAKSHLL